MSKNITIDNEETNFMEEEIQNILNNITETEYKSFKENEEIRESIIDKIFSDFMNYEINIENKEKAKDMLKEYEFIEMEDIKSGDYLKYFNLKAFYNLRLIDSGVVLNVYDTGNILVRKQGRYNSLKPNLFFKKINKETLVKMKLLDIVNNV
jgi:hypothetical protein